MRLFPDQWEGTHPAFPRTPEPLPANRGLGVVTTWGSVIGCGIGLTRILFRRSSPGGLMNAIGVSTAVFGVGQVGIDFLQQHRAKTDVYPLLKADNIPVPRRKLFERTKNWTTDDYSLLGGAVGLALVLCTAAIPQRNIMLRGTSKFSWKKALAGFSVGCCVGDLPFLLRHQQEVELAFEKQRQELEAAEKVYTARTGRPPPKWLYQKGSRARDQSEDGAPGGGYFPITITTSQSTGPGQEMEVTHSAEVVPQPLGSRPHSCVMINGKMQYVPARDYFWKPTNSAQGMEALHDHVDELNEKRSSLVKEAEYLWHEIAKRESSYATRDSFDESETSRRQRKALELLSSMHSNLWTEISELDWLIADTKKMMLQLQSAGQWLPDKYNHIDPQAYKPESVIEKLRQHKQKTEMLVQQLGNVIAPGEDQKTLTDNLREVKENDLATGDLLEDFEERVRRAR